MAATADPPRARSQSSRAGLGSRDIVLSLLALIVPLLLLAGGYKVLFNGDHPIAVDPAGSYAAARGAGAFAVQEPRGLPAGWTVVSSAYAPEGGAASAGGAGVDAGGAVLRVGYVTPGGGGVQVIQSNQPPEVLLPAELGATAAPGGLRAVGTRSWQWYPSLRAGAAALVTVDDNRVTIVIGTATEPELTALATSLG